MAEQKYQLGERVRLKSGGPTMTIASYGQNDYSGSDTYMCRWFDDKNRLTQGIFTEPELERYTEGSGISEYRLERG